MITPGFHCPSCGSAAQVKDSRPRETGGIRRRRRCIGCGLRFTTYEVRAEDINTIMTGVQDAEPVVVQQATQAVNLLSRMDGQNRTLALMLLRRLSGEPLSNRVYALAATGEAA